MDVDAWDGVGRLPVLYAKAATGAIQQWVCWLEGDQIVVEWGQKNGAQQQSRFACIPKNVGKSNATTAQEQARVEALAKWHKQCKKKYSPDEAAAQTGFNLKPMLAKSFQDRGAKVRWPADLQPKFDGLRCLAYRKDEEVFLQSRGGDPYSVAHISAELAAILPIGIALDGELYCHGVSLQTLNSWIRRPQPDSLLLEYHVYDMTWLDGPNRSAPWEHRNQVLHDWFARHCLPLGALHLVPTWEIRTELELRTHHDSLVQEGYEGAIIRLRGGVYRFGARSSELLKYKAFQDREFRITGWSHGRGKFENVVIFRCVTSEGKPFDVVPKGTSEERASLLQHAAEFVGAQLTVRFFDWTDDGVPHFPVGIAVRAVGT